MGSPSRQGGFILASTIWFLAILLLLATYMAGQVQGAREHSRQLQERVRGMFEQYSTRSALLFVAASHPMSLAGMTSLPLEASVEQTTELQGSDSVAPIGGEIRLDDRVYAGYGDTRFSVQDEGGLIGVNHFRRSTMRRLLESYQLDNAQAERLIDQLLDYADPDQLQRRRGAESRAYLDKGKAAPANRLLLTIGELHHVLDWGETQALWETPSIDRLTTVAPVPLPNINTAPLRVLQSMGELSAEQALRLFEARRRQPVYSIDEIRKAVGGATGFDPMGTTYFPSRYLRLSLWQAGSFSKQEVQFEITPNNDGGAPWLIYTDATHIIHGPQQTSEPMPDEIAVFRGGYPSGNARP